MKVVDIEERNKSQDDTVSKFRQDKKVRQKLKTQIILLSFGVSRSKTLEFEKL